MFRRMWSVQTSTCANSVSTIVLTSVQCIVNLHDKSFHDLTLYSSCLEYILDSWQWLILLGLNISQSDTGSNPTRFLRPISSSINSFYLLWWSEFVIQSHLKVQNFGRTVINKLWVHSLSSTSFNVVSPPKKNKIRFNSQLCLSMYDNARAHSKLRNIKREFLNILFKNTLFLKMNG